MCQYTSAIVGVAAAKLVGGDGTTGASISVSETKNNWLGHEQYDFAKELKAALASDDEAKIKDIIARYYAQSNYNAQNGLTGEGDDERITGELYSALNNLISDEDKYWLSRGLNYTLDKMVNTDPEMFSLANEYRNKLDQNRLPETQYSSLDDAINATDKNTNIEVEKTSYETKDPNGDDYIVAIESTVGAAFTSPFLKVASTLYQQSLYGKGETQYFNSGSLVSNTIEDSISFKDEIKELAKNVPIGTTQYYSSSVNMRDNNDNILV
jgi:filamentous hemagglutinin